MSAPEQAPIVTSTVRLAGDRSVPPEAAAGGRDGDALAVVDVAQPAGPDVASCSAARIGEADAVEIWIARWLRIPSKTILARYRCDSRRLYEVWWGERHPGSRARAEALFRRRYPALADRTSYGYRRIPRANVSPAQLGLFE